MKVLISEKQLSKILKSKGKLKEIDEVETTTPLVAPEPSISTASTSSASTSTAGTAPAPYPEVGHWESGIVRSKANQLGNTKWESGLTRGHANKLK